LKILVPLKQVADPDNADRVRICADGSRLDDSALERQVNPFDEYALEAALRLTEDAREPRKRLGEVIAVTLGPTDTETMLRGALATGADRAIRVNATDDILDAGLVAVALAKLARREAADLVLMGKQTVDGDGNEVAQRLAGVLDWPQATFAATIRQDSPSGLTVGREVDGGVHEIRLILPAVVSVDLRIIAKDSVASLATNPSHEYQPGVRFSTLPAIMQSRKKAIEQLDLAALVGSRRAQVRHVAYVAPEVRGVGRVVESPTELVRLLSTEAKVL